MHDDATELIKIIRTIIVRTKELPQSLNDY